MKAAVMEVGLVVALCLLMMALAASGASAARAGGRCEDVAVSQRVAVRAALAVNSAGGFPAPFTRQAYPLNSAPESWAVVLSYSGVQFVYKVQVRTEDCRVLRLEFAE